MGVLGCLEVLRIEAGADVGGEGTESLNVGRSLGPTSFEGSLDEAATGVRDFIRVLRLEGGVNGGGVGSRGEIDSWDWGCEWSGGSLETRRHIH